MNLMIRSILILFFIITGLYIPVTAQEIITVSGKRYKAEYNIPYCTVDGQTLIMNAFTPMDVTTPAPAMIDIHGGWWIDGKPAEGIAEVLASKNIALFSISYRLAEQGGFPKNIRDCRNAVRFIRKNNKRFNIDPARMGCMGGSAGGYLSLMVAMVPENFDDGGPATGLEGISAQISTCFSYIAPTDFIRFWNQGPEDVTKTADVKVIYRKIDPLIPYDCRPRFRILFHGVVPDTEQHKALYRAMSPVNYVRKGLPPLLICDRDVDPIVPGLHGKILHEKLLAAGADSTYWITINGGHAYPGGAGFTKLLDDFLTRTLIR